MEHHCPQCTATVEDGSPFCPNCSAAQIRYSPASTAHSITLPSADGPDYSLPRNGRFHGIAATNPHDAAGLRAAIYAGLVAAFLTSIPLGPVSILAFPIAGFLSVLFYRRWTGGPEPSPKRAFKLGTLTGVFGSVGMLVFAAIRTALAHDQSEIRAALIEAVKQQQSKAADPQARQMLDYFTTPQGMAFMIVFGFIFMGLLFVLLSGLGATVSASLLRRKGPPGQ